MILSSLRFMAGAFAGALLLAVTALGAPKASYITVSPTSVAPGGNVSVNVYITKASNETWLGGVAYVFGTPPGSSEQPLGTINNTSFSPSNNATFSYSPASVGTWQFRANIVGTYTNGSGGYFSVDDTKTAYKSLNVAGIANQPPTIGTLSASPSGGPMVGQSVTLSVSASDPDGSVSSVKLIDNANGSVVATDSSSPYQFTVSSSSAVAKTYYARATDNSNAVVNSTLITITWQEPQPDYLTDRWIDVNGDGRDDYVSDVVVNEKTPQLFEGYINYGAPTYGKFNQGLLMFYDLNYTRHCSSSNLNYLFSGFIWDSWGGFRDRWWWPSSWVTPYLVDCTYTVNEIDGRLYFYSAEPGAYYQIQTRQTLTGGSWTNQGGALLASVVTGYLTKIFGDWKGIDLIPILVRIVKISPPASVSISGDNTLDYYCADLEFGCGNYPAPTKTLTANVNATNGTYQWSIVQGSGKAAFDGPTNGSTVKVKGIGPSDSKNDVRITVTYTLGNQTATSERLITVVKPSSIVKEPGPLYGPPAGQPYGYRRRFWYTVKDEFGDTMGEGICVSEQVTTCFNRYPDIFLEENLFIGSGPTDTDGKQFDDFQLGANGQIPSDMIWRLDQNLFAGGCEVDNHVIELLQTDATLTDGNCL